MNIAIFVTNTDVSDFARARPLDDEKFAALFAEIRPEWTTTPFWVCRGEFPSDCSAFDGVLVTGSPASVLEAAPWMQHLEATIAPLIKEEVPLFGACFGHQIIAKTLGCQIVRNPRGWAHGLINITRVTRRPWSGEDQSFALYGSHIEQVDSLPPGAVRLFESPGCRVAGFAIGKTVSTIQHHPEMTKDFISDLIEEYADYVGPEVTAKARQSVAAGTAARAEFAAEIATFFEQAGG